MANFNRRKIETSFEKSSEEYLNTFKKYPVGCDEDKEKIFCFPFILDKETILYIENYAKIMFIIRGPPSTGKASLSEMITERYPHAIYCCADRYFTNSFSRSERTRESIKESHVYCTKKAENACKSSAQTIIVQNTHMRKWEMQQYLDFAALYNYTVIMAITLYRFDCTPKALAENNTDGLDIKYFINRLRQWEDVLPLFTGWFISPDDSSHILSHTLKTLEALLNDGKFCRVFDVYDIDGIKDYFKPRQVFYCPAAFSKNPYFMKKYYLSDLVQASYGKCFPLYIYGYMVTTNGIFAIVYFSTNITHLLLKPNSGEEDSQSSFADMMNSLNIHPDLSENFASFPEKVPEKTTVCFEDQDSAKELESSKCCFIDLARKEASKFDIETVQQEFNQLINLIVDANGNLNADECTEIGSGNDDKIFRLPNDKWFIKPSKIMCLKSIFTGYYV
ncbi:2',3'-cyclic-nucleotide 3'-phosphodiesterase isoform X2 [Parasteatoda tepidariorum]|uniref:2',3'-cyclic-nucleotide 3'-phosphodiesterase isoform X1 n=1 Tax=Parasteatoda tepidariorum TaxID=114398 RepID=UPI001C7296D5|nr:2',3'-cyclic-nucleotide 3'-phosphodiesterase isoform X1 [Parasteatoda tepidariorum]XP_042906754.1 2',3'-cyclic-nucleotide 3'-phosphodiesterase isoform X1 [Parasteatoda tepidariorum]XP_042906755.1 2',3'-cyclic-nucleotide 3'-phosphodiesterase isoform X1 [Parasteatoda tepidariorum]XP_042906757.1 2',3'-cyclic-nucleotide 3'-phosphodiesterase isoform X1 [Parasteatoda tepidariorum]XP_042906758.1 2',3'-cyclic-nucleotide 3'-phosphodiesterase isoform X2 [Parasteatoda tepidariorum]XP_042906759.1 2',3'